MTLNLLKPLSAADLAMLAANDDKPDMVSDWLTDRDTPAADVALMYGQGIKVDQPDDWKEANAGDRHRAIVYEQCNRWSMISLFEERRCPHCGTEFVRKLRIGETREPWHLPQATLAVWAGCVYGEERRGAVEAWRIEQKDIRGYGRTESVITDGKEHLMPRVLAEPLPEAAAQRELRRRVLRLFPEVARKIEFVADCRDTTWNPWHPRSLEPSEGHKYNELKKAGFRVVGCRIQQAKQDDYRTIYSQIISAQRFADAEYPGLATDTDQWLGRPGSIR